jgi:MYXO-CTERM domain-containing protein
LRAVTVTDGGTAGAQATEAGCAFGGRSPAPRFAQLAVFALGALAGRRRRR